MAIQLNTPRCVSVAQSPRSIAPRRSRLDARAGPSIWCCQHAQHETHGSSGDSSPSRCDINRRTALLSAAAVVAAAAAPPETAAAVDASSGSGPLMVPSATAEAPSIGPTGRGNTLRRIGRVAHSEEEWRQLLTPAQYATLRQAVTEAPRSSPLYTEYRQGVFRCAGCGSALFDSAAKFDAGTGWPSFYQALPGAVMETNDFSAGMRRTEVRCSACQGHLGHVFRDGPPPTNLRYCMNGVAMTFAAATA